MIFERKGGDENYMGELKHYGTLYYSGRYPWGSGENPYQRWNNFYSTVQALRKEGLSDTKIAAGLGITTTQLRNRIMYGKDDKRLADANMALKLKDKGYSNTAIGRRMGISESSVRSLLDPVILERTKVVGTVAATLVDQLNAEKGYIDVGKSVELHLGVSSTKLNAALAKLEDDGYSVQNVQIPQLGTGKFTTMKVLASPGTTWQEIYNNKDLIRPIIGIQKSLDGGKTFREIEAPRSVDSKKIEIRYLEDGGGEKDGLIELRRGVEELSLGNAKYAQVRIAVDGTHYIKGMALHSDNMPSGVDIVFYTNKSKTDNKLDALKNLKASGENPFGANIKLDDELIRAQRHYIDKNGKEQLSAINIVNEEGNWEKWSKNLSSQMLSKQQPEFARQQLNLAYNLKAEEYEEIKQLTNPVVQRKLLRSFSDDCDASAVHLKAASMPRQNTSVILPIESLKDNEVYAPNYKNGEHVVLIRYPHGGRFEIPELIVNNKNREAKSVLGSGKYPAIDAVGINSIVAQRLSGADFDGDTVLVIPNPKKEIKASSPLARLANFDPHIEYKAVPNMKIMGTPGGGQTNQKMGDISNLITDMTIKGANDSEIVRAVRHSMVVIDAEKHKLNYAQSYIDHGIAALKTKYQGGPQRGAATLISKASSPQYVPQVKDYYKVDEKTGELIKTLTGKTYVDRKTGVVKERKSKIPAMALVKDAFKLSSGTRIETEYAIHANKLKALANDARKTMVNVKSIPYSPSAKEVFKVEVDSLLSKLNIAKKNAPLERMAQAIAGEKCKLIFQDNPTYDEDDKKKIRTYELKLARSRMGANKQEIFITDKEWLAIQSGAFTNTKLTDIIDNADLNRLKQLSTPRSSTGITPGKLSQAKAMFSRGYTQAEVAEHLGISIGTLVRALNP